MNKASFILLAGGTGSRMKRDIPKQFLMIAGKPIIMHILERIDKLEEINEIIIVCHSNYIELMKKYINSYMIKTRCIIINGGDSRQESVFNGLKNASNNIVIIHEAARPFVKLSEFKTLINSEYNNVIYGRKIPFTVLQGKDKITGLLQRDELINVQLPQKFDRNLLLECHKKARDQSMTFTEDSSMVYFFNKEEIYIIEGTEYNIKITDSVDLLIGEIIYNEYILSGD